MAQVRGPHRARWEASQLSTWGRVSVQWLNFFLQPLIDHVKPSGPGVVFVGKLFVRNPLSCLDLGPFRVPLSSRVTFETLCLWRYLFPRSRSPSQIWKQGHLVMDVIPGALGTVGVVASAQLFECRDPARCPERRHRLVAFGSLAPVLLAVQLGSPPPRALGTGHSLGGGAWKVRLGLFPSSCALGKATPLRREFGRGPPAPASPFCLTLSLCKLQL